MMITIGRPLDASHILGFLESTGAVDVVALKALVADDTGSIEATRTSTRTVNAQLADTSTTVAPSIFMRDVSTSSWAANRSSTNRRRRLPRSIGNKCDGRVDHRRAPVDRQVDADQCMRRRGSDVVLCLVRSVRDRRYVGCGRVVACGTVPPERRAVRVDGHLLDSGRTWLSLETRPLVVISKRHADPLISRRRLDSRPRRAIRCTLSISRSWWRISPCVHNMASNRRDR